MSLSAAVIDALVEAGATVEQLAAAVKADLAEGEKRLADKRAKDAARQRKSRASRNVTVTPCDGADGSPYEDTSTPSGTDLSDEASASSPLRQPITAARDAWNENAAPVGWPTVNALSATRTRSLGARLREHGLEGWRAAIARARASPYLGGTDPPSWFTFNWLIKSENFLKLIEGNYDRSRSDQRQSAWGSARDQVRLHPQ